MSDIMPCPFCENEDTNLFYGSLQDMWTVVCRGPCDAQGRYCVSKTEAIAVWNRVSASVDLAENLVRNSYPNLYDKVMP